MTFKLKLGLILIILMSCSADVDSISSCETIEYPNKPSIDWFKSYGGSGEESHGHYILSTNDGGYIQIGETGFLPNNAKIFVVKVDQNGQLIWQKEYTDSGHNFGNSVLETDDGYLLCGVKNDDSFLVKVKKESGDILFSKTYENGGSDAFEHLLLVNNQIFAVGYTNSEDKYNNFYSEGESSLHILDLDGNIIKNIDIKSYMSHAYRIKSINNDIYISGLTDGAEDYALIKMNQSGQVIWSNTYGGTASDHCFAMDVNDKNEVFLSGHTTSQTANWDTYTMKIDKDGNKLWEVKKGNPRGFDENFIHDEVWGVSHTDDGGCIITAGTGDEYDEYSASCDNSSEFSNQWKVYSIKFSSDGSIDWEGVYGLDSEDWAGEDIDISLDGKPIIAVDNGEFGFLKLK